MGELYSQETDQRNRETDQRDNQSERKDNWREERIVLIGDSNWRALIQEIFVLRARALSLLDTIA